MTTKTFYANEVILSSDDRKSKLYDGNANIICLPSKEENELKICLMLHHYHWTR